MVQVYGVRPEGVGGFARDPEGVAFGELNSIDQYVKFLRGAIPALQLDEIAAVETAARLDNSDGGIVLAWREPDGSVNRQVVYEE
jgi:hypothetical protein